MSEWVIQIRHQSLCCGTQLIPIEYVKKVRTYWAAIGNGVSHPHRRLSDDLFQRANCQLVCVSSGFIWSTESWKAHRDKRERGDGWDFCGKEKKEERGTYWLCLDERCEASTEYSPTWPWTHPPWWDQRPHPLPRLRRTRRRAAYPNVISQHWTECPPPPKVWGSMMGGTFAFASHPPAESPEVIAGLTRSNPPSLRFRARDRPRRVGGRRSGAEHPARRSGSSASASATASSQKRSLDGWGVAEFANKSEVMSNALEEAEEGEKSIGSKGGFNEMSDSWSIGGDNVSIVKRFSDGTRCEK